MNHSTFNSQPSTKFLVRFRGYAVQFVHNHCGKVYSLVADDQATQFPSATEAVMAAKSRNFKQGEFKIERAQPGTDGVSPALKGAA